ncbi:MAG: ABC-type multidrug transport system, permease component [uncultured bacterium]|nr:MAG: ABC-type multidrug transport system, permease component [uncultured bacterium]OGT56160.1 MAG: ABC transporter permease [Gammaproteobacteria bacterium RIFCSPHIGHO2_12_FULL_42_10]
MPTLTRSRLAMVSLQTLLWKECLRFLRIWSQTLLPPVITMTLYFVIFGKFIGSQIHHIDGYAYIQYISPGLILMSVMTNAYANTASSFFTTKFNKSIEEMLVSPMPNYIILLGYMLGGTLRGMLVGGLVLCVALLFTHIPVAHPLIVVSMALFSAAVFSLGGLINGIFARRFDDIAFIPTFVLTPLTYLGGVFYSIKQLPPLWRSISIINPVLDMVNTFRYGLLDVTDLSIASGFILIVGFLVTLFCWALILLNKGIGVKI